MHASGNSRRDGTRDGALRPQSWCNAAPLPWDLSYNRLPDLSFSIIQAVAHASAWLWIGKRRICRLENRIHQTTNPQLTNELSRLTRVLRRRRGSESKFALPNQHQVTNVNKRVWQIRENPNR